MQKPKLEREFMRPYGLSYVFIPGVIKLAGKSKERGEHSPIFGVTRMVDPQLIIVKVCEEFEVTAKQIRTRTRKREWLDARQVAFHLIRKHTRLSLSEIGKMFKQTPDAKPFDHATVLHGDRHIISLMAYDTKLRDTVNALNFDILEL